MRRQALLLLQPHSFAVASDASDTDAPAAIATGRLPPNRLLLQYSSIVIVSSSSSLASQSASRVLVYYSTNLLVY